MYSYEDRVRAVELYIKLGKRVRPTILQLGYPSLPFPRNTSPAAVLRAQRHVATSTTTLRQRLSYQLIARLGQCPC